MCYSVRLIFDFNLLLMNELGSVVIFELQSCFGAVWRGRCKQFRREEA